MEFSATLDDEKNRTIFGDYKCKLTSGGVPTTPELSTNVQYYLLLLSTTPNS